MTKREAAIVAAYTGVLLGDFNELHKYIEKIIGGAVFTHQLGDNDFIALVKEAAKADFISLEVK